MSSPACIAVAGFDSVWGFDLRQRLKAGTPDTRILELDGDPFTEGLESVEGIPVGWSEADAEEKLAEVLKQNAVEVLAYCGSPDLPIREEEMDPDIESRRIRMLLAAVEQAGVRRLIVASSTLLYGALPDNPNFLAESHPLRGHPQARWMEARIEAESCVQDFALEHPQTEVTVLRSCWTLGPRSQDPVSRFLAQQTVPTCLGYDPLLQFIHEEDLLSVYEQAILQSHPGLFNVVGRGVLPVSTLLALAGKRRWPLPAALLERWPGSWPWERAGDSASAFQDYLRYLWVAAGERGWSEFGEPGYSSREAWISFATAQRRGGVPR